MLIKYKQIKYIVSLFILIFLLTSCKNGTRFIAGSQKTGETVFLMYSDFSKDNSWIEQHLRDSTDVLVKLFNNPQVSPPASIKVTIHKDLKFNGIAGAATPMTLSFRSDKWPKDSWRMWILVHELTNLFAAHYGGCGSYPSDWWADGRSPFPSFVSSLVLKELGYEQESLWLRNTYADKLDHKLYWSLHEKYGFGIFERFFKLIGEDKIDFSVIGAPWPKPDANRSLYTAAYLSMAAGANITDILIAQNIGKEPSDWHSRYPDTEFVEYSIDPQQVDRIIQIRGILAAEDKGDIVTKAMKSYRSGNYRAAEQILNSNRK